MKEIEIQKFLLQSKKRADQLMDYFLFSFFAIGILLSFFYDTYLIGIGVGGLSLLAYYSCKLLLPGKTLYQYTLGAVLGIFMAQFIYQMHGMFEMHFFAFIGSAILIIYRNWKLQIPLAIIVISHHALLGYLQFSGVDKIYFTQLEYMSLATFIIHILLAAGIFFLCGLWSYKFRNSIIENIQKSFEIGKLQEAGEQSEVLIALSESLKGSNEKLKKAHDELQKLFENIEEAFFSIKIEFLDNKPCYKTMQMSRACRSVYGYESLEFFKSPSLWRSVIVKEDQHLIDTCFSKLLKGFSVSYENRIRHKDGSMRWVHTKIKPTLNNEKLLVRIDGITSDITQKKAVEESLQRSEANLRTIFDNTDTGYLLIDKDLKVISFNNRGKEFVKLNTQGELSEGSNILDYFSEERKRVTQKIIKDAFEGKNNNYEISYPQEDGHKRWYYVQLIGVTNKDEKVFVISMSINDITERKIAETKQKQSFEEISGHEKLMKSAESLAHFGSWKNDYLTEAVEWSDETFRLYGYEPDEYPASFGLFLKHVHPDDKLYVTSTMQEAVQLYDSQKLSFRIIDKYGTLKYIEAAMIIERDTEGNVINVFGFKQDVTEKVLLKNNLEDEKKYKLQQITDAVITAQENERLFLGEELHDNINPILATVKLYMDCAISNESMRMKLIKDSKDFVTKAMDEIRILSKSLVPPSLKEIGLLDAVNDMVNNIKKVNELDILTDFECIDEDALDEKLKLTIFRIIQEQLNNIFKHAQAKKVMIQLKQSENKLQLIIKDDGIGFDTSKKRRGLGLQNIASRADLFNGSMYIETQPGKGCNLVINFLLAMPSQAYNTLAKAV